MRIGIDEVAYRKGHRYLTCVTDHDSGRLVWAAPGRSRTTLTEFFTALGPERCAAIEAISVDPRECPKNPQSASTARMRRSAPTPSM